MEGSAKKIYEAALGTPEGHSIIFLAHNGPTGLGSKVSDICGRDWVFGGGDHGDPDLAQAISDLRRNTQIPIPIVVFGHMHKELAYGNGLRKMIEVVPDNTIYLNGAMVPRVKMVQGASSRGAEEDKNQLKASDMNDGTLRAFTLVEIMEGRVEKISEIWLLVAGNKTEVAEENILFR
ncbi:hypothetical protein COCNU_contig69463550G000010 [Cocos nucifera]|nr:hypothetical protein [Cocos nucifera]